MKKLTTVLLVAAAALACRGRSTTAQRNQPQYEVVQEGQTSGASSTINAPAEVTPPVSTTTVDTTGSFTLPATSAPLNMPGGTTAGALPPPAAPPLRRRAPVRTTTNEAPVTDTTNTPVTDTTNTTDTTNSTAPETTETTSTDKPKKNKDDTPPPPTQTDTIGQHM